jgi:hypothetical protein
MHGQYNLPDDKNMMFETCRRPEELNENININNAVCWLTLHNSSWCSLGNRIRFAFPVYTLLQAVQMYTPRLVPLRDGRGTNGRATLV